ncbi:MAG: metallophosphoesterase [Chloroflexi bacterium]|nr:metallophosphoesterase [Chloroflexota bacterium]
MLIGFIGDVHGQVFHAIALAVSWQVVTGKQLDLLIQVGDMGAFPDISRVDAATERYMALDPSQMDFMRLLGSVDSLAESLRQVRQQLASPIYFVRGNHEDFEYLGQLHVDETLTAPVDTFDLLRYVPDGTVLQFDGVRVAFLGGVEEHSDTRAIDKEAYKRLMSLGPGEIDVLVTHEGPYGTSIGYQGDIHGSKLMTGLIERSQPHFHIAGHAHQLSGPTTFGRTTYLGLDGLAHSARWYPEKNGFKEGCMGVLDTAIGSLQPVTDLWLSSFNTKSFDFDSWFESAASRKDG